MSELSVVPSASPEVVTDEVTIVDPAELSLRLQPYSDGRLWEEHVVLAEINAHAEIIIHSAYQIGRRLHWTKEVLGHGAFTNWCQAHLPFSMRTIRNYMRVATFLVDHPRLLQPLARAGMKKTLLLTSMPRELTELVDETGLVGEVPVEELGSVPYVELKLEVERLRASEAELNNQLVRTELELRHARDAVASRTIAESKIEEHAEELIQNGWRRVERLLEQLSGEWELLSTRWDDLSPKTRAQVVALTEAVAVHTRYEADAMRHRIGEELHSVALAEALEWSAQLGHPIPDDRQVLHFTGGRE